MKNKERSETVIKQWNAFLPNIYHMFLDEEAVLLDQLERPEILGYLPSFKDKSVLDLASGIGRFTTEFAREAKNVVAVDISSTQIEQNKIVNSSFSNVEYICTDAMDLTLESNQFDLIFISWLFIYLEDDEIEILVPRLASWLKPGGTLFFKESCAARKRRRTCPEYFAIYRGLSDYPRFFKEGFTLMREGSIIAFEEVKADPYRCYWLYKKN